jgi:hypothetical protein
MACLGLEQTNRARVSRENLASNSWVSAPEASMQENWPAPATEGLDILSVLPSFRLRMRHSLL